MTLFALLGWVGNVAIAAGLYGMGNKKRGAFLFSVVGETCWIIKSIHYRMFDLAVICVVFALLALRSYRKWKS